MMNKFLKANNYKKQSCNIILHYKIKNYEIAMTNQLEELPNLMKNQIMTLIKKCAFINNEKKFGTLTIIFLKPPLGYQKCYLI